MSKWSRIDMDAPIDCTAINLALWNTPEYRAERDAWYAFTRDLFADHDARERAKQQARWAAEEAEGEALVARMNLTAGRS